MLDPLTQLFQHCWGHARSLRMVYNDCMGCILPTMHRRSQHCCELLHPFGHHCQHALNNVCTQPYTSIREIPCRLSVKETNGVIFYFYNIIVLELARAPSRLSTKPLTEKVNLATFLSSGRYLKGERKQNKTTTTTTTTTTNNLSLKIVTSYGRVSFLVFVFSCCSFVSVLL